MDASPFMPIIIEATRFLFSEIGKWIDSARERIGSAPTSQKREDVPTLTAERFHSLDSKPAALKQIINEQHAKANAYIIQGIVEQLKIHRKNLVDHETTEAEYGALTPQHIKRAIEREAKEIVEKSERLRHLLEDVYGEIIEL